MTTEGNNKDGANSSEDHPPMPEIKWIGRRPGELPEREPYDAPASSIDFCEVMTAQFPDLAPVLAAHREDHGVRPSRTCSWPMSRAGTWSGI